MLTSVISKIRRIIRTRAYRSPYVALGEKNRFGFPPHWITVDWQDADFTINLRDKPRLPLPDDSSCVIYSAHMIEHLPDDSLDHLLQECFRLLKPGGYIRLEAPDHEKLRDQYVAADEKMLNHFRTRRKEMIVDQFGYPDKYLDDHLSLLGEISNYIVPGEWVHMPAYAPRHEFDEKLRSLSFDDFCNWCVSLQTPEQLNSGGHQNSIYFEKIGTKLRTLGFQDVSRVDFGVTGIPNFELNGGPRSIKEKPHRHFYSLYVEARKPAHAGCTDLGQSSGDPYPASNATPCSTSSTNDGEVVGA